MNNWCICWFFTHMLTKCTVQESGDTSTWPRERPIWSEKSVIFKIRASVLKYLFHVRNVIKYLLAMKTNRPFFPIRATSTYSLYAQRASLHSITLNDTHKHTHTHAHSIGILCTMNRPVANNAQWQLTTPTREKDLYRRRDSNLQFQEAYDGTRRSYTAWPLGSAPSILQV
jgi:hypothetical protein